MRYKKTVHWHEGLFLRPHHLQLLQNNTSYLYRSERHLHTYHPYGIIEIDVSESGLENHIIKLNQLTAIMPGGIEISMPGNAHIPPLNIKDSIQDSLDPITIYLAVPIWSRNEPNSSEDTIANAENRRLYNAVEKQYTDENIGDNPQSILMREVNTFLVIDKEVQTDVELLPLLEIQPLTEDNNETSASISTTYIPPCLCMGGSKELSRIMANFLDQLRAFREELVVSLKHLGYNPELLSGILMEKVLQLRTLNSHTARLDSLLTHASFPPYELYLELRSLLGELAALQPMRDLYDISEYDHDNCRPVFVEIISRIRNLISLDSTGSYTKIPFTPVKGENYSVAELTDEHIVKAEDYFLAVETRESPQKIISLIEAGDQFKLIAFSQISARIRGVRLKEERYPPPVLPAIHNVIWFRLKRSESTRSWNKIRDEKKIALAYTEEQLPQITVSLYITVYDQANTV